MADLNLATDEDREEFIGLAQDIVRELVTDASLIAPVIGETYVPKVRLEMRAVVDNDEAYAKLPSTIEAVYELQ